MHYYHHYSGTNREMEDQALESCKGYLGKDFNKLVGLLRQDLMASDDTRHGKLRQLHHALSFIGIQGRFPVRAMYRAALGE